MSRFSNFAISFSIICILSGESIPSPRHLVDRRRRRGHRLDRRLHRVGVFRPGHGTDRVGLSDGRRLYHWASILGNRFTGWLTAWLNLLGLITVMGAINIGTSFFFVGTFGGAFGMTGTPGEIVGLVAVITVLQALFNHFGIGLTAMLTDASGFLILAPRRC